MDPNLGLLATDIGSVAADLALRFRDVLPDTVIEAAVRDAAGELRGQVPPGAFSAMLHQLATYRLHEHVAASGRRMSG